MTETDKPNRSESDDGYSRVVVHLNSKWRVIACRSGIQWILQRALNKSRGREWIAKSYCRTKQALIRSSTLYAGEINRSAWLILDELPDTIEGALF